MKPQNTKDTEKFSKVARREKDKSPTKIQQLEQLLLRSGEAWSQETVPGKNLRRESPAAGNVRISKCIL